MVHLPPLLLLVVLSPSSACIVGVALIVLTVLGVAPVVSLYVFVSVSDHYGQHLNFNPERCNTEYSTKSAPLRPPGSRTETSDDACG